MAHLVFTAHHVCIAWCTLWPDVCPLHAGNVLKHLNGLTEATLGLSYTVVGISLCSLIPNSELSWFFFFFTLHIDCYKCCQFSLTIASYHTECQPLRHVGRDMQIVCDSFVVSCTVVSNGTMVEILYLQSCISVWASYVNMVCIYSVSYLLVFYSVCLRSSSLSLIDRLLWSYSQLDPVSQNRIFADNGSKMLFLTLNQQCQSTEGVVVLICFIQLTFSYDGLTEQIATNHNLW